VTRRSRTVVLDNEAVQVLLDGRHRKHRRLLAAMEVMSARNVRRSGTVDLLVPTTVRVEAGWDRLAPDAAKANQLRAMDSLLDGPMANRAVQLRKALEISVTDAHLGAVLDATPGPHTVFTSDVDDLTRVVDHLRIDCVVVRV
jgi:hypothetical protein